MGSISTVFVDKCASQHAKKVNFSTVTREGVDNVWITFVRYACKLLQSPSPGGRGKGHSAFAFNMVGDLVDLVKDITITVYEVGDFSRRVHNGGVVTAAESASDFGERFVGELTAEVHGDLPWIGEGLGAAGADEVAFRDTEVTADLVLDELDGDLAVSRVG